jgi:hypothetical protein
MLKDYIERVDRKFFVGKYDNKLFINRVIFNVF